ncbi:MAG: multiheme c-type cytochrome [Myxococcota bacterium]|nr:multiheme c-type cytochrome [Myxococcota bacterium]
MNVRDYAIPAGLSAAVLLLLMVDALRGGDESASSREGNTATASASSTPEVVARAWDFYKTRPYYERPREYSPTPEGLGDLRASTCGACHQQIYQEWAVSTHRHAWLDDAQFQEELAKSRGKHDPKSGDVGWLCVNCHTPNIQQLPELVVGLEGNDINKPIYEKNPTFDKEMQLDAITCATCHVKDGVVYGPYGDTNAPHATARGEFLLTEQVCTSCHQAEARYPVQNLGCFFSTGEEWRGSPYAERGETCQSCHMPHVDRKVAEAFDGPIRRTRRHWFGGSLIPKKPEYSSELEPLEEVFGSGVTLDLALAKTPEKTRQPPKGLENTPKVFECDIDTSACVTLRVDVTNSRAGHMMPSGDPERHIEVEVVARDKNGEVVARGYDLIGSRYKWWPEIELLEDTRIAPMKTRSLHLSVPATSGELTIEITADKQRMYSSAFEHHHLEGKYVRGRRFYNSTWKLDGLSSSSQQAPTLSLVKEVDDLGERTERSAP